MFRSIRLLLIVSSLVFAQAASAQNSPPPDAPKFDTANDCYALYPAPLLAQGVDGTTTLSLRILVDGSYANASVLKSSGNAELDAAALKCAAVSKRILPITSNGKPVEVQWQGEVIWRHQWPHVFMMVPISTLCPVGAYYPPLAVRLNHEGSVKFAYQIAPDGTPENFTVLQSSGYPELDQAAMDCTTSLHFPPAIVNGKPTVIDRESRMNWRLRD